MTRRADRSVIGSDEVVVRLHEAEALIRAACRTLDDIARLAPSAITDRLNEVEGQADLGVTACHLRKFAAQLERESSTAYAHSFASSQTVPARTLAPSKSRRSTKERVASKTAAEDLNARRTRS